jgi:myo-inositol-1(or 4)-monophosphatase
MNVDQNYLSEILETAVVAARLAGQRAMEEIDFVKTSVKKPGELVTQTDIRCQQLIIETIKRKYPDHGFIAEEGEQGKILKYPPRSSGSIWWAVDPIDGTNNFAHQIPIFTVSIAALYNGEPIAGAVFEPATDSIYTAVKGGEAQLNGRHIVAGEEQMNEFSSVALDSHFGDNMPGWVCEIMRRTRFRNFGTTALHFGYVAKGSLAAAIVCTPKLWDIAAGTTVVESGGGVVTDWRGNKIFPIDLDAYEGQAFHTLVANRVVHQQIVDMINSNK